MKLGIFGDNNYDNAVKIKTFLCNIKSIDPDLIVVIKSGKLGASEIVSKNCKWNLNIPLIVFPTYHEEWTADCEGNNIPKYMFGKKYSSKHYYMRDNKIVNFIDCAVYFGIDGIDNLNKNIIELCNKKKIEVLFEIENR